MGRRSKPGLHPSGYWRFTFRGHTYWSRTYELAAEKLATLQGQEARQSQAVLGVAGLVDAFLAHHGDDKCQRGWLKSLAAWGVGRALVTLPRDTLAEYARHLVSEGYKPASVAKKVRLARIVFVWGNQRGYVPTVPDWPRLPTPVRNPRGLTPDDVAAILARLEGQRAVSIVRFILATGCRPSEACRLTWGMFGPGFKTATLTQHKTAAKTGRPRTIYLTPEAIAIVTSKLPGSDKPDPKAPVFLSVRCEAYTPSGVRSAVKRAARLALGRDIGPYVFRHTFAQSASRLVPVDHLAKLMGHRSIVTTQRYYDVQDDTALAAAASIAGLVPPLPSEPRPATPEPPAAPKRPKRPTRGTANGRGAPMATGAEHPAEPQPGLARARAQASPAKPGQRRKQSGANQP